MIKTQKIKTKNINKTRKIPILIKLQKTRNSRIYAMDTYKLNCGQNLLYGFESIKSAEETHLDKEEFVHVIVSILKDYDKPVIVKIYDANNPMLYREKQILKRIDGYRNAVELICDFSCDDDKKKYISKIKHKMKFCMGGEDKIHIFVYKYIEYGDISDYLIKIKDANIIKSVIIQMACIIIELASKYNIFHGDLNSGNILIDKTNEEIIKYKIDNELIEIPSYGIIPKIIDFGKSRFFNESLPLRNNDIWYDIINFIGVIANYIKNKDVKNKLDKITNTVDMDLPLLKDYVYYLIEHL